MARLAAWKGLSVLIAVALVLSLGMVAVPIAGTVKANTVRHVATNCTGIPAPCYTSIQAAINASSALGGDTILVHPGKYNEKVIIDKSLTLQSTDGWQNTTIDPLEQSIIWIQGDVDVTVEGFEISNGTHGVYIPQLNSTVNISGCFIHGNVNDGIHINNVPEDADVTIADNLIVDNGDDGIDVAEGGSVNGSVTMKHNVIGAWRYDSAAFDGNNDNGIHIGHVSSTGSVTIDDNAISENGADGINFGQGVVPISGSVGIRHSVIGGWTYYPGDYGHPGDPQRYTGNGGEGISIVQVANTGTVSIERNAISENALDDEDTGIYIWDIHGVVTIAHNSIGAWEDSHGESYFGNAGQGILVTTVHSGAELTIGADNHIKQNTSHGIEILAGQQNASIEIHHNFLDDNGPWICGCGIKLGSGGVCGAMVSNNTITNHHKGIHLDMYSTQNTIQDNEISNNGHGIWVVGDDNHIIRNNILNNVGAASGIHLTEDAFGNVANCNNFKDNLDYGVCNNNTLEDFDARNNWWGSPDGPSTSPGTGDPVSANVTYDPWLPMEFQYCPECGGSPPAPPPPRVPTLSLWGMVSIIFLFIALLVWTLRRRRPAS